jgi:hypothetical protein
LRGTAERHSECLSAGEIELPAAQKAIAADWIVAYKQYVAESLGVKPTRHRR